MKALTLSQFIDEVIPTRELQDAQTIADIRRIVANTPIFWDEQEYTQDEVITELWHNRTRYA